MVKSLWSCFKQLPQRCFWVGDNHYLHRSRRLKLQRQRLFKNVPKKQKLHVTNPVRGIDLRDSSASQTAPSLKLSITSGWWYTYLWKTWKSIGMMKFPYMQKYKSCSSHHQPDMCPPQSFDPTDPQQLRSPRNSAGGFRCKANGWRILGCLGMRRRRDAKMVLVDGKG